MCTGRAKSAIKDTIIGDKSEGLKAALSILKREFGSNNTLNRAALDKLMKKGEIAGDYKSLSDLSLDMSNYQRLMVSQKMQHELDSTKFDEPVDWFPAAAEVHHCEKAFNVLSHLSASFC